MDRCWWWLAVVSCFFIVSNLSEKHLFHDQPNDGFTNETCFRFEDSKSEDSNGPKYRLFATKTTYLTARQEIRKLFNHEWPREIRQCSPVYLFFLNRHSIRYPSGKEINTMNLLLDSFRNELINNGKLTYKLFIYLVTWRSRMVEHDDNHISDSGVSETAQTARIFHNYFPTLLDINHTDFDVGISSKIRTKETADAFIDSLIDEQFRPESSPITKKELKERKFRKIQKNVLMSHKFCKNLIKAKGSKIPKSPEYFALIESPAVRRMLKTFSERLGLSYTISIEYFIMIYKACSYEIALFGFSPWCHLFTQSELKSVEYLLDVDEYFDAYEVEPHRKMACSVIGDLQSKLRSMMDRQNTGRLNATLYFSHENLLSKVMSYFGLFEKFPKNRHHDGDTLCIPEDREFRSSLVVPFGTNFAAVLYKCPTDGNDFMGKNESFKILTLVNEIPVIVRGCDGSLCDIEKFFQEFQPDQNECDLEAICKI